MATTSSTSSTHDGHLINKLDNRSYKHDVNLLAVPTLTFANMSADIQCDFVGTAFKSAWDCHTGLDFQKGGRYDYFSVTPTRADACREWAAAASSLPRRSITPRLPTFVEEEYVEWAGVLEAVAAAPGPAFTVVELGARWGTWTVRSLVSARLLRPELEVRGVAMEAFSAYAAWAREAVRLNGLEERVEVHAVRANASNVLMILQAHEHVDLLDIDIQGAEAHLLTKEVLAAINDRVGRLQIGVHAGVKSAHWLAQLPNFLVVRDYKFGEQRTCERLLMDAKWAELASASKCKHSIVTTEFGPMYVRDGILHMLNTRFRSQPATLISSRPLPETARAEPSSKRVALERFSKKGKIHDPPISFYQPGLVMDWFHVQSVGLPLQMPQQTLMQVNYILRSESRVFDLMRRVFAALNATKATEILVDSGANDGFWSVLAAAHSITAVAIEPQSLCLGYIAAAAKRNELAIELHQKVLSSNPISVQVRDDDCSGGSQYLPDGRVSNAIAQGRKGGAQPETPSTRHVFVQSVSLDELLGPRPVSIGLWHIDTEGAEVLVLRSATGLFAQRRIRRVLLEWSPQRWASYNVSQQVGLSIVEELFKGWTCQDPCGASINWREHTVGRLHVKRCRGGDEEIYCRLDGNGL